MSAPLVIVGAGQAAVQAIASLRGEGYAGDMVLYGDEPYLPYQRPPLSKAFLGGEMSAERLELKARAFYTDSAVTLHLGTRVARLLPAEKVMELADGGRQPYCALILATGTRARTLPVPGATRAGVHAIRTIDDVRHLRAEVRPGARLVIIGGGYIGLEAAAKARALGLEVTVVESQPRLLARVACPALSGFFHALHAQHGVTLITDAGVAQITGTGRVSGVTLIDGRTLPADLVLSAVGAVPNTELAAEADIPLDNGIAVDAGTRTRVPGVHAIGDVASFPSTRYGRRIRLESVQNAIDQAKAAAKAVVGADATYDPVPWFWSDQYDVKLQIAGLLDGFTQSECTGDLAAGRFSVRYFAGERLIAVASVNDPKSHMLARRALAEAPPASA